MPLTLNQFLLLVTTIAVVVAVTFLVNLLRQLRKTAREAEETLIEFKMLVGETRETSRLLQSKIEDVGELVQASKKTAVSISEIAWFVTTKLLRPSSKYWPFLFPLLRIGWRQAKKFKEEKNVR
ncbi:MAG: hypothetical protein JSV17_10855 [Candidatus Aminicenantes bacterium]|nr:MAG: hypothetical protein JSV17_10855 [Candidatus Aminicenantes bacterium]